MKLNKQKIKTIILTLILIGAHACINYLQMKKILSSDPEVASVMCIITAFFVFFGCMLQTFGHRKLFIAVVAIGFFGLCICFLYSASLLDYVTFAICMFIVVYRSNKTCDGMCNNPLR